MPDASFDTLAAGLAPALQALEARRKELKASGHKQGLVAGAVCLLLGAGLSVGLQLGWGGAAGAVVLALIAYFVCVNRKSAPFSAYYKEEIISKILHTFCEQARFVPSGGISESVFRSSDLFASPNRYHTEDLMEGRLGKTDFQCAEVHAEERRTRSTGKGRVQHYWVDIFRGFFFVADFHKDFKGVTTVRRDSLIKICLGGTRVKLENPDFEKIFDVYSTDQVEARYLITPALMERLLLLERRFGGGLSLCFRQSKVIIAIPDSKNHFEASVWHSMSMDTLQAEFQTIGSLIGIIDELRLNTRIWSKE